VHLIEDEFTPATYNDPELVTHCVDLFGELLGPENIIMRRGSMGGEDFSRYSRDGKDVKGFIYWIGVVDEPRYVASLKPGAEALPSIHSATFRPDPEPTIRTGVKTMCSAALSLMPKK
jgi:metal-dependent amidase/aminoacylase/carboxypeptidase family protein